jgi:hypothetical protein
MGKHGCWNIWYTDEYLDEWNKILSDTFNIFSENMGTCLEGAYLESVAIEKAKEQSRTIGERWIVHDKTGAPHYVAARGKLYKVLPLDTEA